MSTLPHLSDIDTALDGIDTDMRAAEAHGVLCGMLCARGGCDLAVWAAQLQGGAQSPGELPQHSMERLSRLHRASVEQLNDALAEFHLLLPDEDDNLPLRVRSLAEWCQGFCLGLSAGGISQQTKLPPDTSEIINDIISISRAGVEEDEPLEEADEEDFMELVEYIRTGVLLINEELQPLRANHTIQ